MSDKRHKRKGQPFAFAWGAMNRSGDLCPIADHSRSVIDEFISGPMATEGSRAIRVRVVSEAHYRKLLRAANP